MKLEERVHRDTCALLVIDVQNDFCHPQGAGQQRGKGLLGLDRMIPNLEQLIEQARIAEIPVIFIRTEHDTKTDSPAWLGRYSRERVSYSPSCRTGSWGAEFYQLSPQPDEIVITKHRYSAFVGTSLEVVLKSLGRSSLLFTGVVTNVCVESSLRDAVNHDYYATLIEDCCAAHAPEDHEGTIRNVQKQFGVVAASQEIMEHWRK